MKCWKEKGQAAAKSDMKQLDFRYTFKPKHYRDLNEDEKKIILESHMFLKEKINGTIKGKTVAVGNKKNTLISKEYSNSPTV